MEPFHNLFKKHVYFSGIKVLKSYDYRLGHYDTRVTVFIIPERSDLVECSRG